MAHYAVCPTCEGRGTHVNPAVDGNGLTQDDIQELGPDFLDDYLGGVYDVRCRECLGRRVVPACRCGKPVAEGDYIEEGDESLLLRPYSACYDHLSDDEREWYQSEAETAAMYAAELRMGA